GNTDAFIAKLSPDGSTLVYSTYLGGGAEDTAWGVAVDASGSAFITGDTQSSDLPLANPLQPSRDGVADAFVSRISPNGSSLIYSTYLGGSGIDSTLGITVDTSSNAYLLGSINS